MCCTIIRDFQSTIKVEVNPNLVTKCSSSTTYQIFFLQGTTSSCQQDPCLGSGLFTGHTQKTIQIAPGDLMGFWVEDHQATAHAFLFVRNLE
jgi:hypothetical protein